MTWTVRHLTQTVEAGTDAVIAIAGAPQQLPRWAAGLSAGNRNEAWCVAWYTEAGPITSGWTSSRVATATTAESCDSNDMRRFRIAVNLWYSGGVDYGTVRSAPWYDVDCDV